MVEVDIIKQGFEIDLSEIRKLQQDKLKLAKPITPPNEEDAEQSGDFLD